MSPAWIAGAAALAIPFGLLCAFLVERVPDYEHHVFRRPFGLEETGRNRIIVTTLILAVTWAAIAARFPRPIDVATYLAYGFVALTLALIDIRTQRLPDRLVLPATAVAMPLVVVLALVLSEPERLTAAYVAGLLYFGLLFVIHLILGPRALGFGDVKLAALMGLAIGWSTTGVTNALALVFWSMFLGFLSGALLGLGLLFVRRKSRHYAFGPFLVLGSILGILLGPGLLPS